MQSNIARGVRRLLVAGGTMTLLLSAAAPGIVSASQPEADHRIWVCHRTASDTNPWELNQVSVHAAGDDGDLAHHGERTFDDEALADALGLDSDANLVPLVKQLDDEQLRALCEDAEEASTEDDVADETLDDDDDSDGDEGNGNENPGGGNGNENPGGGNAGNGNENPGTGNTGGDGNDGDEGDEGDEGGDDTLAPPAERPARPIQVGGDAEELPTAGHPPTPVAGTPATETSSDSVEAPAPPAPPAPTVETPAPNRQPEVLGVTTTRTPTRELRSSAVVTSLPRTGSDMTPILALVGGLLIAAGFGLAVLGRRGRHAAVGGRR
jgi:LPXTG-motif cell wall-anchored protein